jgi:hypothetical protein
VKILKLGRVEVWLGEELMIKGGGR